MRVTTAMKSKPAQTSLPSSGSTSSPADISKQIKLLLKQSTTANDVRADSARLDELRKLFAKLESSGELVFTASRQNGDDNNGDDDVEMTNSDIDNEEPPPRLMITKMVSMQ